MTNHYAKDMPNYNQIANNSQFLSESNVDDNGRYFEAEGTFNRWREISDSMAHVNAYLDTLDPEEKSEIESTIKRIDVYNDLSYRLASGHSLLTQQLYTTISVKQLKNMAYAKPQYSVIIPLFWLEQLDITPNDTDVKLTYDGKSIMLEKAFDDNH